MCSGVRIQVHLNLSLLWIVQENIKNIFHTAANVTSGEEQFTVIQHQCWDFCHLYGVNFLTQITDSMKQCKH